MEQKTWEHYLRRPGKLDKWTHYGAGGRRVCPRVPPGLPAWKHLALDCKLPYMPAPSNVYLTRGLPAEKLLSGRPAHDFRLFDAYCRELNTPYESLHDRHLKKHLNKDGVVSCSRNAGHMNNNNEAMASLKKLNKFRQMTRLMNLDHIHYRMDLESQAVTDERRLQQIEDHFHETQYKWEMKEKFKKLRSRHQQEISEKAEETLKRWHAKFLKKEQQVEKLQKVLLEKQRSIKMRVALREQKVERNLEHITHCKRKQLLGLKRKLREREIQLTKRKAEEASSKAQQRIEQIKQKWDDKCAEMTRLSVKSKAVVAQVMETHRANIEKRKERAARVKKAQEESRRKRFLMSREKQTQQLCEKRKKPRENENLGVADHMVDFLIDTAIINYIQKIITPLMSWASRLAIEHGVFVLNEIRMAHSKTPGCSKADDGTTGHSITMASSYRQWSTASKRKPSIESVGDSQMATKGSSVKFEQTSDLYATENACEGTFAEMRNEATSDSGTSCEPLLTEILEFPEKDKLENSCEQAMMRLLAFAKFIISECVEPRTRALTIKKLTKYEHDKEELIKKLALSVYQEDTPTEAIVAAGLARGAVIAIFNPPEWRKRETEYAQMRRLLVSWSQT